VRIVYVITRSDEIGGAHIHVRDFSLALLAQGHEVTVLAGGSGTFTDELQRHSIPFVPLRHLQRSIHPVRDVLALAEMRATLARIKPDLVSTHSAKAGWIGRVAAWSLRIPVIYTAHGWAFTDGVPARQARLYRWAERAASAFGDRTITVCEHDRALALKHSVATAAKMIAVHNGMPDVAPSLQSDAGKAPPRVVMVARFEQQKDHATALRALAGLVHLEWELDLVGDGPNMGDVQRLAAELGVADRVHFLGRRRDVAQILSASQIFILITNWEGFPRSILEAMRARLPVIATAVAGSGESVAEGSTGFLVPRADVDALRGRLALLLGDAELRAAMGSAGRRRYEERFLFGRTLERTVAVYREVLAARSRNPRTATSERGAGRAYPISESP